MSPDARFLSLAAACFLLIRPDGVVAADPAWYLRKSTWSDTLLASWEAVGQSDLKDGFEPFESETLRGGQPARRVSLPLSGAQELYLFVTGVPDVQWGVADWAEAKLVRPDGTFEWVSHSNRFTALLGRYERDLTLKSGLYQKMRLNGRVFDRGLHVQADSILQVPLDGEFERFEAWIGVDDWAGTNGSVRFSVLGPRSAARKRLFEWLTRDFAEATPRQQMRWEQEDRIVEFDGKAGDWLALAARYAQASHRVPPLAKQAAALADRVQDKAGLNQVRGTYQRSRDLAASVERARCFEFDDLRQALQDLEQTFSDRYPKSFCARLDELEPALGAALAQLRSGTLSAFEQVAQLQARLESLAREALLANPLLDFDQLLVIKRQPLGGARRTSWEGFGYGEYLGIPRQSSWNYGTMPNVDRWTNQIAILSPVRPEGRLDRLFQPEGSGLVNDIDLHWDADRLLFSMPDANRNWQVWELALGRGRAPESAGGSESGPGYQPRAYERSHTPLVRQLTPSIHRDVHNYDGIYLPGGDILFLSTAPLQGVPCNASVIVGMTYRMGPNGERIRQLTFEQDHDYTPSVLNNGRVLYLRWDYTDTPHVWNRLLMSMNPDGTGQMEYYGANSYWPNAMFFARAIPNDPTKVVTIVTGHHEGRVGELFILDPAKGRHETDGVVQRIPHKGPPVQPKIEDKLTEHSWPKFLHPWPLSDKYFLVACKPEPDALWGIYLVDVFDHRTLVKEEEGFALLEPVPLAKRPKPPVIQDRVVAGEPSALVYLEDIYRGPGLKDVPPGTVKALRLFTYHFGYQKLAGIDHRVGADGPWETKRVLGTVPVEADGSAFFQVPAKTPISFQPLDAEGKAVALMRSWMTAMPGESVSCVGCHDRQSTTAPGKRQVLALTHPPARIQPWRGPVRGFSFARDVQPVLDKFCVGCHDAGDPLSPRSDTFSPTGGEGDFSPGRKSGPFARGQVHAWPDLRRDQGGYVVYRGGQMDGQFIRGVPKKELLGRYGAVFEPSYVALRQFVRVGGLESDLHLLPPKEFHADTSELIQMLAKGHHRVKLDAEAWDRLVTWIDLNAPCHGTWGETTRIPGNQCQRRLELRKLYEGVVENGEEIPEIDTDYELPTPVMPEPEGEPESADNGTGAANVPLTPALSPRERENGTQHPDKASPPDSTKDRMPASLSPGERAGVRASLNQTKSAASPTPSLPGWPMATDQAKQLQAAQGRVTRAVDLGDGVTMRFVRIPAGAFVMGDPEGPPDERPTCVVRIDQPFWMAECEVSNEQYARFDSSHDSRFEHRSSWIFDEEYLGWPLNQPRQPVVRVSWQEAMAFCRWLSARLGEEVALPTEAQWEWACRAGTDTPMSYGSLDTDFSRFGNLGDANLRRLADEGWRPKSPDLVPKDARFNDGALVTAAVGRYQANAWGLHDMHGNAAEWTRSRYQPYPYRADDGRDDVSVEGKKVVRGGSWRDRPKLCRSGSRWAYPAYQKVFNVGFRAVIEPGKDTLTAGR